MKIYFPELYSKTFDGNFNNTTPNLEFDLLLENDFIENFLSEITKLDIAKKLVTDIQDILFFCKDFLEKKKIFLLHTSGSTGTPKTIEIGYTEMCESIKMTQKAFELTEKDVFCVCLPTQFIAGKMMLARALYLGCEMWIYTPSTRFLENVKHDFSFIALVPPQLQYILADENQTKSLDKCRNIIVGGSPVSVFLRNEIQEKLKNAKVFLTYSMTETVSHIALQKLNFLQTENSPFEGKGATLEAGGQLFYTLGNVEIAQVSDKNSLQFGCLKIKSTTTKNEWITTNDSVEIYTKNTFKWLGRVDNVVNIGGKKIQLEEIDQQFEVFFTKKNLQNLLFYTKIQKDDTWGASIALVLAWDNLQENEHTFLLTFPAFSAFFKPNFLEKLDLKNVKNDEQRNIFTKKDVFFIDFFSTLKKEIPTYFLPQSLIIVPKFEKTVTQKIKRI